MTTTIICDDRSDDNDDEDENGDNDNDSLLTTTSAKDKRENPTSYNIQRFIWNVISQIFDKTFKVGSEILHEQVEVNKEDNTAKFYLEKDSIGVIDFKKVCQTWSDHPNLIANHSLFVACH